MVTTSPGFTNSQANAVTLQSDGKIIAVGRTFIFMADEFAVARYNTDGSLDTTFDDDGFLGTSFGMVTDAEAHSLALQTDGKIVVAGEANLNNGDFALVRYNSNGTLDTAFDTDGRVTTDFGFGYDYSNSVVVQQDGKIVAAGAAQSDFALARYNSDGSLDTSFDIDGKVTTDFYFYIDRGNTLFVQSGNRMILAGTSYNQSDDFALAGYLSDGSLDTTFGNDGLVSTDFNFGDYQGEDIVIQPDGKIIIAGSTSTSGDSGIGIARINQDGSLDDTFAGDGTLRTDFSIMDDYCTGVALQGDNKIVVFGTADGMFALARFNPDGSFDISFGTNGIVITDLQDVSGAFSGDVVLQPDDKILVVGGSNDDFTLVRYNSDGSLDNSFGTGGIVSTDFFGSPDTAYDLAIQSDGKILAAGYEGYGEDFGQFGLARYNEDGSLDTTFDLDGLLTTNFTDGLDGAHGIGIQSDGRILVVGIAGLGGTPEHSDFALARYNLDGSLDTTFDVDGMLTTDFGSSDDSAQDLDIQPDGMIIAAGNTESGSLEDFALARYETDGTLDTMFGGDGKITTDINFGADEGKAVALQTDGRIIVGGFGWIGNSNDYAVARYLIKDLPESTKIFLPITLNQNQ